MLRARHPNLFTTVAGFPVTVIYDGKLVTLGLAPAAVAQLTSFRVIDYPGAKFTRAMGINEGGDIVGYYADAGGKVHGYSTIGRAATVPLTFTGTARATTGSKRTPARHRASPACARGKAE